MTTTPETSQGLKSAVREAVDQIAHAYPDLGMSLFPDGQGGTWVELTDVPLGSPWAQETTFVIFLLPFALPACDIYPMFIRPDLTRLTGVGLDPALQVTVLAWPGDTGSRPVIQVSRRTRGTAFTLQNAPQKIEKVLDWLRSL